MHEEILAHPAEAFLAIPFLVMGLSHIIRPTVWQAFFTDLGKMGPQGVILRTFALEIWPAAMIVAFHQEWSWPGIVLTVYGHALLAKITLSLLVPEIGLRSLRMAQTHGSVGFRLAGLVLLALSGYCAGRIFFDL